MYPATLSSSTDQMLYKPENRFAIYTLQQLQTEFAGWNEVPDRLHGYELFWIKNGKGELWIDDSNHTLRPGMITLLSPGFMRKIQFENAVEGYFIYFQPEFLLISGTSLSRPDLPEDWARHAQLTDKQEGEFSEELETIVLKMLHEFTNTYERRIELLKGLLHVFIIYINRHLAGTVPQESNRREREIARQFMSSLRKNFFRQKSVGTYAAELYVTPNYLNRVIKKITGLTVSQQIQKCIIQEAKRKAIYTQCSMKEIAYELGFDNIAHFSKFFRNYSGMNFSAFRTNAIQPGI